MLVAPQILRCSRGRSWQNFRKTLEGSHTSFCRIFFHGDTSTSKFWLSHYWNPWFSGCPLSPKIKRKNWIPNASHDKLTSCNGEPKQKKQSLVGGIPAPLKNINLLISQMRRIIPYMNWKIKNVWNHQPDQICGVGKAANHPQIDPRSSRWTSLY